MSIMLIESNVPITGARSLNLYADLFNDVNYAGPNNFLDEWNKEIFKFGFNQQVTMDLAPFVDPTLDSDLLGLTAVLPSACHSSGYR